MFIRVADDGAGMSAAVRESAFDPFFTTRSAGDGVGLGLSVAHGIVVAHGGRIELESIEGHGTAVTMYIPGDLMTTGDEA
ncbi:MAG: ATP-binding protein [bacterium]